MADFTPEPQAPISVKATATPVVVSETFKIMGTAFFAVAADQLFRSDLTRAAVIAASGPLLIWGWGVWHRVRTWGALRYLAHLAPDDVAQVGK